MSNVTIKHILDTMNKRDATKMLSKVIRQAFPYHGQHWSIVVDAAKNSALVNSTDKHVGARSMPNVSASQILDRMSAHMVATVTQFAYTTPDQQGPAPTLDIFAHLAGAFSTGVPDNTRQSDIWPFSQDYYDQVLLPSYGLIGGKTQLYDMFKVFLIDPDVSIVDLEPEEEVEAPKGLQPARVEPVQLNDALVPAVDQLLATASGGKLTSISEVLEKQASMVGEIVDKDTIISDLRKQASVPTVAAAPVEASGDVPNGTPKRVNAQKVFGTKSLMLDFDICVWDWDGPNPHVPDVDKSYIFDVEALSKLLFSWEFNINSWSTGPTGCGKSTMIEQACARTRTMLRRVNFDSDLARYDIIGKVDIKSGENGSVTFFKEGIVPQAMQMPCVLLLDEADAIRGDINYAMQAMLEGKAMLLTEDGGRQIQPHPLFRIAATANTVGGGDASGLYSAGVKVQSRASINRYGVFIEVDYMPPAQEMKLVKAHVPAMSTDVGKMLSDFLKTYRKSYETGAIQTPVSPRNTIVIAKMASFYEGLGVPSGAAVEKAIVANVVTSADDADRDVIKGIADKCVAAA